ncbi:hypothetical protein PHMEG_00037740 [Phytophthora megakarya]|uniref:Uncharacterized protein n=1 Tax=Phytophthora megakarya TaxID=4795 RepID=A0A225UIX3_9STRA|nr:hypothetical protein PHMEG_00037740 [Phytophthora megakarya]
MENKLFSEHEMNAVIKSHQEKYDRLENRFQFALRSNEILTKGVNHGRSEYLVWIQAFKKSHENRHKILCQTDPKETTLTPKRRERNRDVVRRVKRLEKANSALSSRLRLEDMDPEALGLMVDGEFSFSTCSSVSQRTYRSLFLDHRLRTRLNRLGDFGPRLSNSPYSEGCLQDRVGGWA